MKSIGDRIMKVAIYVLGIGIAFAIISMIIELLSIDMITESADSVGVYEVQSAGFVTILGVVNGFAIRVFVSYVVHLLIAGYGRIVKDNELKAQYAKELNSILENYFCEESENDAFPWEQNGNTKK